MKHQPQTRRLRVALIPALGNHRPLARPVAGRELPRRAALACHARFALNPRRNFHLVGLVRRQRCFRAEYHPPPLHRNLSRHRRPARRWNHPHAFPAQRFSLQLRRKGQGNGRIHGNPIDIMARIPRKGLHRCARLPDAGHGGKPPAKRLAQRIALRVLYTPGQRDLIHRVGFHPEQHHRRVRLRKGQPAVLQFGQRLIIDLDRLRRQRRRIHGRAELDDDIGFHRHMRRPISRRGGGHRKPALLRPDRRSEQARREGQSRQPQARGMRPPALPFHPAARQRPPGKNVCHSPNGAWPQLPRALIGCLDGSRMFHW